MAFSNQTPNYGFPQWEGSDKAVWTDMNPPYLEIDTQLKANANGVETANNAANAAQSSANIAKAAADSAATGAENALRVGTEANTRSKANETHLTFASVPVTAHSNVSTAIRNFILISSDIISVFRFYVSWAENITSVPVLNSQLNFYEVCSFAKNIISAPSSSQPDINKMPNISFGTAWNASGVSATGNFYLWWDGTLSHVGLMTSIPTGEAVRNTLLYITGNIPILNTGSVII